MSPILILPVQGPPPATWFGVIAKDFTQPRDGRVFYYEYNDAGTFNRYLGNELGPLQTSVYAGIGGLYNIVGGAYDHVNDYVLIMYGDTNTTLAFIRSYDRVSGTLISTTGSFSHFPNNRGMDLDYTNGRVYLTRVISQSFLAYLDYPPTGFVNGVSPTINLLGITSSSGSTHVDIAVDPNNPDYIWAYHATQELHRYTISTTTEDNLGVVATGCSSVSAVAVTADGKLLAGHNGRGLVRYGIDNATPGVSSELTTAPGCSSSGPAPYNVEWVSAFHWPTGVPQPF